MGGGRGEATSTIKVQSYCHSHFLFHLQTFLAQRYGHKPLRTQIPVEELKLLCAAMEDPAVKHLVQKWYTLDTNAVPLEYVLQSPDM